MPDHEEITRAARAATAELLELPGVVAVGLGSKEVAGRPVGRLAIKVYVRRKLPAEQVPEAERIPAEIAGFETDVIESGDIVAIADPPPGALRPQDDGDGERHRPVIGGSRIADEDSSYRGTAGCLLWDPTDHEKGYALTCQHVVDVPDTKAVAGTTKVGQPSGVDSCTDCCDDIIGVYAGGGRSGDRDEALVRLSPGTQWVADILEIGPVRGTHTITLAEAQTGTYPVRKRGRRTRLTGGRISALTASTSQANNLLIIAPNPNPAAGPGDTVFFAFEGDSGSALMNDAGEVTGLVWARSDAGLAFAYPIAGVLGRFASVEQITVEVATATAAGQVHTVPGAALAVVPEEIVPALAAAGAGVAGAARATGGARAAGATATGARVPGAALPVPGGTAAGAGADLGAGQGPLLAPVGRPWFPGPLPPPPRTLARLRAELDRSPTGRLLLTFWLEHQDELLGLVRGNRRVMIVWHRQGGAAVFQLLTRMLVDPELAIPRTVHGRPLAECVDALHEVLARHAGPRLRADLDRVAAALPDLAGLTYAEAVAALGSAGG